MHGLLGREVGRSLPGVWADQLTVGEVGSAWVKVGAVAVNPCRWRCPRSSQWPCGRLVLSSVSCGQEMVAQRRVACPEVRDGGGLPQVLWALGYAHQDEVGEFAGKSWEKDTLLLLGPQFPHQ